MPDELATRATLLLTLGVLLCLGAGALSSLIWRKLRDLPSGANGGLAVGLTLFAAGALWVVWDMAAVALERRGHTLVLGELIGFEAKTLSQSRSGRKLVGEGPVVAFRTADGQWHELLGLAGSQRHRQLGDAVPVRLHPTDPALSVVADFQHDHAALLLFGAIAAVAALFAAKNLIHAAHDLRPKPKRQPPPTAWERWRDGPGGVPRHRQLVQLAWATFALSVAGLFVVAEFTSVGRALAAGLAGVAVAVSWGGLAAAVRPGHGQPPDLLAALAGLVGMGGFAALVWAVT